MDRTFAADPLQLAGQPARGRRPEFTDDPTIDYRLGITVTLDRLKRASRAQRSCVLQEHNIFSRPRPLA
jgi:hypothetical protein